MCVQKDGPNFGGRGPPEDPPDDPPPFDTRNDVDLVRLYADFFRDLAGILDDRPLHESVEEVVAYLDYRPD